MHVPLELNDDGVPVELAAGGMPGGGPCTVEISLAFESTAATRLPELWAALAAVYGADRIGAAGRQSRPVGGPFVSFAWRVSP